MMKKYLLFLLITMLLTLTACGSESSTKSAGANSDGKVDLRLGHIFPEQNLNGQAAQKFADLVNEYSKGSVEVKVFPSGQLGGDEELGRSVSSGSLDIAYINQGSLAGLDPLLDFHYLPYIVGNFEEADQIFYGDGIIPQTLKETLQKHKMYTLGFFENEFRAVSNSKRAIETVEDIKGLKLRVPGSQSIQGIFEEVGAQTTAIPFPELYTALEQGTVDGQDNGVLLSYDSKFQEAQEFITLTNHVYATGSLVINDGKWSSLTEDQQEAIQKAADEALQEQIKNNRQRIDEVVKSLKKEGVKVNELSEEEMNRFKEIAQNVWVEMEDVYGKERIDQLKEEVSNLK